jgi:large subunit ribosomal protein L23
MKIKNPISVIKKPIINEKATNLLSENKYTFLVDRKAKKSLIKDTIEYLFDVNVTNINTLITPKKKRTVGKFSGYKTQCKKAIITIKSGETINLFPNINV